MTALQKLGVAFTVTAGGAEIVVWAAADTPGHPGVQTAMSIVLGAIALGVGTGFALGAAFSAGRGEETAVSVPFGVPPWRQEPLTVGADAEHGHMRVRPATEAPLPVRSEAAPYDETGAYDDDFVWDGTFTAEALEQIAEHRAQFPEVYPAEPVTVVTQVDMAPVETTRQMPPVVSLPPWTPAVAPNAVPVRVEVGHVLGGRHAAPERPRPDVVTSDWFRRAADRQESAA